MTEHFIGWDVFISCQWIFRNKSYCFNTEYVDSYVHITHMNTHFHTIWEMANVFSSSHWLLSIMLSLMRISKSKTSEFEDSWEIWLSALFYHKDMNENIAKSQQICSLASLQAYLELIPCSEWNIEMFLQESMISMHVRTPHINQINSLWRKVCSKMCISPVLLYFNVT